MFELTQIEESVIEAIRELDTYLAISFTTPDSRPSHIGQSTSHVLAVGGWIRDKLLDRQNSSLDVIVNSGQIRDARKKLPYMIKVKLMDEIKFREYQVEVDELDTVESFKAFHKQKFKCSIMAPKSGERYHRNCPREEIFSVCVSNCHESLFEDYCLRDFTVNAVYFNLKTMAIVPVIDSQGKEVSKANWDRFMEGKKLRTFAKDPSKSMNSVRCLRAVRMQIQFGIDPAERLQKYIAINAFKMFRDLPREEINHELYKLILDDQNALKGVFVLTCLGFWKNYFQDERSLPVQFVWAIYLLFMICKFFSVHGKQKVPEDRKDRAEFRIEHIRYSIWTIRHDNSIIDSEMSTMAAKNYDIQLQCKYMFRKFLDVASEQVMPGDSYNGKTLTLFKDTRLIKQGQMPQMVTYKFTSDYRNYDQFKKRLIQKLDVVFPGVNEPINHHLANNFEFFKGHL